MPQLPQKFTLTQQQRDDRLRGLEQYLRGLVNRKDTCNSRQVTEFLRIQEHCPEIMFNVPQLLVKKQYAKGRQHVTHCLFLQAHNLYAVAVKDRSSRTSRLEIFSFR